MRPNRVGCGGRGRAFGVRGRVVASLGGAPLVAFSHRRGPASARDRREGWRASGGRACSAECVQTVSLLADSRSATNCPCLPAKRKCPTAEAQEVPLTRVSTLTKGLRVSTDGGMLPFPAASQKSVVEEAWTRKLKKYSAHVTVRLPTIYECQSWRVEGCCPPQRRPEVRGGGGLDARRDRVQRVGHGLVERRHALQVVHLGKCTTAKHKMVLLEHFTNCCEGLRNSGITSYTSPAVESRA